MLLIKQIVCCLVPKYNKSLQLTAQIAAALWVSSAGCACSGGN